MKRPTKCGTRAKVPKLDLKTMDARLKAALAKGTDPVLTHAERKAQIFRAGAPARRTAGLRMERGGA